MHGVAVPLLRAVLPVGAIRPVHDRMIQEILIPKAVVARARPVNLSPRAAFQPVAVKAVVPKTRGQGEVPAVDHLGVVLLKEIRVIRRLGGKNIIRVIRRTRRRDRREVVTTVEVMTKKQ
jgi:hypothetical protein